MSDSLPEPIFHEGNRSLQDRFGRYQLVQRSRFVPRSGVETPFPAWKTTDWAADALPEHDPARAPDEHEVLDR